MKILNVEKFISEEEILFSDLFYEHTNTVDFEVDVDVVENVESENIFILSRNVERSVDEYEKILNLIKKPQAELNILKINDDILESSFKHLVFTKRGYISVDNLKNDDEIYYINSFISKWINQQQDDYIDIVDLEVRNNNNYYVNNILSHNSEPGGKAAPFHATIRVRLAKVADIKNDDKETIGITVKATTKKNKIAPYNRSCEFNIYFNKGIDDVESWRDNLVNKKVISRPTTQKYSIEVDGKEYEFKKDDWSKILVENNLYDKVKDMVVKANTIDYDSFVPSYDELSNSAKILAEEEVESIED
jgi:hypothetical protein